MRKNLSHIIWIIIFLICPQFVFSQNTVSVKATVDRRQILIGEPIQLMLEAKVPLGTDLSWFPLDSIPHFEFIEKGKIDSATTADEKSFRQYLIITSFDSGNYTIPALPIIADNIKYFTDSINIEVNFSKFDPKQDYHDIKDVIEVENPDTKYIVWIISGTTLVSVLLLIYLLTKEKSVKNVKQKNVVILSPYEEAIKSLGELKKQKLPEAGQVKLFYTRLNDILRMFVLREFQIAGMEKTNDELIMQLKQLDMSNEQFSRLAQVLRMSDFVKFAKYLPGEKDNAENFDIIQSSIELLNTIKK